MFKVLKLFDAETFSGQIPFEKNTCLYFSAFDIEKVLAGTDSLADRALVSSGTRTDTSTVLEGDSELFL